MIRHRSFGVRRWTLHLLMLCALTAAVTRAVLPVGYMAMAEGDRIVVTLCGSGQSSALDLGGDEQPLQAGGEGLCLFAMAVAAAPPPAVLTTVAAPIATPDRVTPRFPKSVHVGLGLAAPPPPSHAPPALV